MELKDDDIRLPGEGNPDPDKKTPAPATPLDHNQNQGTPGERRSSDVAIIGMSGRFAGSPNLEAFWSHLQAGESCIEPIRRAGWQTRAYSDPDPDHLDPSLYQWGGMLEHIDQFDPFFFNISPHEAVRMDPQQRLFLEEAYKACEDAGYSAEHLSEKPVGVFVGARSGDYKDQALQAEGADARLFLGNDMAILAARISYFLNWKGPSLTIDTASSSSLVAIHLACESLYCGESEMALAGGVFVMSSPEYAVMAAKTQMLSPDGQCKTFDKNANGIVLGEGVGALLLKPLAAALADGDHIHGVIVGSAMNQDGRTKGMTAPSLQAQKALLVSLYKKAAIDPETVSAIEAHGTGSRLGDPIEVQALTQAFQLFTEKRQFCAIGSHKPNIGHTISSAGIAGVLKILLAMKYQQLPPTIHVEEINPAIDWQDSPFFVNTEIREWKRRDGNPRRAGVSSFGLSGTNCHLILEEPPLKKKTADEQARPAFFFPISAKTRGALTQKVGDLIIWLEKEGEEYSAEDISYTLVQGRSHFSMRSAVVARDTNDLLQALREIHRLGGSEHERIREKGQRSEQTEPLVHQYGHWLLRELRENDLLAQNAYQEKLAALADLYVKGHSLDWGSLFKEGRYHRVPLPTYPFSGESYWIAEPAGDQSLNRLRSNARVLLGTTHLGYEDGQERRDSAGLLSRDRPEPLGVVPTERLREALTHSICDLLSVPVEEIDAETPLSEYGIDSITFTQFAHRLNQTYQLDLTPALFYEYSSIERLTHYLHATYANLLAPYFGGASPIASEPAVRMTTDEVPPKASSLQQRTRIERSAVPLTPTAASSIAIIGMSGSFPQAPDVQSLWNHLLEGKDGIGEIPPSRWDWQAYFGNPATEANKTNVKWAGIVEDVETFDPLFFNISRAEAEQMDPQQRLLMMYVWKAIEDAGYSAESLSGTNTALFVGTTSSGYSERVSRAHMAIEGYSSTGQTPSVGPGRMSYFLNLHGPSEAIETACSSSLVAIHRGVNAIESGQCSVAIVGGINTLVSPELHISYSKAGMLCEDGRCKTFSAQANGYVRGEGVGMLVLKKLVEAEQAGDHIYGVIRATAENHGGRANSLTAPNPRAQADLLIAAYRKAGIDPRTVSYIEAHGTGTPLGDPIEINGLKTAFSELWTGASQSPYGEEEGATPQACCGIGSVKSNIGHLELAAGVAGVIKVLLQMQHKKLVKSLHCEQINPYIQLDGSPFYIVQENHEWEVLQDSMGNPLPRRAGVSSFGLGGANAHVVLEEYVPKPQEKPSADFAGLSRIIVLSAKNEERLQEQVRQLLAWVQAATCTEEPSGLRGLGQASDPRLQELAYTLQVGRVAMEERLALQVSSLTELGEKLSKYLQEPQEGEDWYRGGVRQQKDLLAFLNTDEECQEMIDKWIQRGKYEKLLQGWIKGLKIAWKHLYKENLPCRISLPTYPFARERYWLPPTTLSTTTVGGSSPATTPAVLHPLVQRNTSTLWEQRFSSTFRGDEFFLADHVVKGHRILPGVAYLEMARAAVREALGNNASHEPGHLQLSNIVWVRPLAVGEQPVATHITLSPQESGTLAFLISSAGGPCAPEGSDPQEKESTELVYCQGMAELRAEDADGLTESQRLDVPAVQARCPHQISGTECYQRYRELGLTYGPAFQGIEHMSVGEGEMLARFHLPVAPGLAPGVAQTWTEGDRRDGSQPRPLPYVLHPSVLDAALHAYIGLLIKQNSQMPLLVPFALSDLSIESEVPTQGWTWIRQSPQSLRTGVGGSDLVSTLVLDIEVCDDAGRVAVRLRGLSLRPFLGSLNTLRTLLLIPDWKEEAVAGPASASGPTDPAPDLTLALAPVASNSLVLLCGLPDLLASRIQAQMPSGGRCRSLSSSHLRRELRFQDVVLQLIQELQHLLQSKPAGSVLVQVVVADGEEPSRLSALGSVLKVAQQEYPKLRGQLIEIEGKPEEGELLTWLRENQLSVQDQHVRYRNGKRWVRAWQEHPLISAPTTTPWKEGGCYLITGGAGGLARIFVQEIAQQVQEATIILVGRSALSAEQQAHLAPRGGGKSIRIDYQQVDVSDGPAVHALIQSVLTHYGQLNGIIHAAGVLRNQRLLDKTPEEVRMVLSPKVIGVEQLDEASAEIPLDFFLLCSSLSAVLGGVGLVDYAAANAYLDAFAHARTAKVLAGERQGKTLSINWPYWEEGGMRFDVDTIQMMRELVGEEPMGTETGMKTLYQALALGSAQVVVLHGQVERIKEQWLRRSPASPVGVGGGVGRSGGLGRPHSLGRTPSGSIEEEQRGDSTQGEEVLGEKARAYFKKHLAALTKLPAQQIETSAPLSDYGFDSIMVIRFTNLLEKDFGPLSKTLLFEHPTLDSVSAYFQRHYPEQLRKVLGIEEVTVNAQTDGKQEAWVNQARRDRGGRVVERGSSTDPGGSDLGGSSTDPGGVGHVRFALPGTTSFPANEPVADKHARQDKVAGVGDIAIIGVAGRYPGARDLRAFWENLRTGRDCITEIPSERWDYRLYFDPDKNKSGTTYSKWGGFLDGVDEFDPLFFNISPREAEKMDPQERLFLECAFATLEDAGYTREALSRYQSNGLAGNVGVFVGVMYEEYQLFGAQEQIQGRPMAVAGYASFIANRVSYFCNFHGPSLAVDTACSSSLTAIHLACQSIQRGECELAIAGGVNVSIHPNKYLLLGDLKFVSSQGHCQSFGVGADGYVPGEGVGAVLLKPLSQAERDGDHIYGVIKATAINHGGKTNGFTVPNPHAQAGVIRQTLKEAGIDPRTISYIEAHGTGTALGDPIEIAGLTRAFYDVDVGSGEGMGGGLGRPLASSSQWCAIGSVKSNIGHAEGAAGIAGVTKVLLQMRYGQLVPSLHSRSCNPHIDFSATPFVVQQELTAWERPQGPGAGPLPRRAGISSFGAGGANAHVILEEYVEKHQNETTKRDPSCPVLLVLSARTQEQLHQQVQQLLTWIQEGECAEEPLGQAQGLQNLAYTLQVGREAMEERLAFQIGSLQELEEKLRGYVEGTLEGEDVYRGQVRRYDPITAFAADEDGQKAIAAWMSKGKYGKLLEWWVKGLTVDWKHLYGEHLPRRISLPTYPFACERYWISTGLTQGPLPKADVIHPLVQRNTSTLWEQRFSSTFRGDEFFLADHVIKGQQIMPGAVYLEMAYAAVREAMDVHATTPPSVLHLSHVVWVRPLVCDPAHPVTVHITLSPQENGSISFDINRDSVSRAEDTRQEPRTVPPVSVEAESAGREQAPSLHCQGVALVGQAQDQRKARSLQNADSSLALHAVQARCQYQISAAECYQHYSSLGLDYGPAFQAIEQLSRGKDEVLAQFRLPAAVSQTHTEGGKPLPYVLHPSVLDAALHACIGLLMEEHQGLRVPFALDECLIEGSVPTQGWIWVRRSPNSGPGLVPIPTSVFDIEVCDDAGRISVRLRGLSMRQLSGGFNLTRTRLLTPGWKEEAIPELPGSVEHSTNPAHPGGVDGLPGSVSDSPHPAPLRDLPMKVAPVPFLVLLCDFPDTLALRIQTRMPSGVSCRSLLSSRPRRDLHFQDIVWQLIQEIQLLRQSQLVGNLPLQESADVGPTQGSRLAPTTPLLVQVVVVHRQDPSFLEALASLLKVVQQEYPRLRGQLIEVDGEPEERELLTWLRENQLRPQELHIRYRDGQRWVREWQAHPEVIPSPKIPWKESGCYLISGGAGGLGRLFVQEIARHVQQATIVLVGRSPLSAFQQDQLEQAGQAGMHLDYQQVDVSDGAAVHDLMQSVLVRYGHLDGIIHAAGVLHTSRFFDKTQEEVRAVLSPKASGVELLDEESRHLPLDFFILCSSLSAVLGGVGFVDYAAANAYLDAFAHARRAKVLAGERQGETLSINWPYWEAGGMQIDVQMMRELLGEEPMGTEVGMKTLYQALALGHAQVVVLHGQVERIKQQLLQAPELPMGTASDTNLRSEGQQAVTLTGQESQRLQEMARAYFKEQLAALIKLPAQQIDIEAPLLDYGFDSIMAIRFANELEGSFGSLSKTLLYEYPTIQSVTQYFLRNYPEQLRSVLRSEVGEVDGHAGEAYDLGEVGNVGEASSPLHGGISTGTMPQVVKERLGASQGLFSSIPFKLRNNLGRHLAILQKEGTSIGANLVAQNLADAGTGTYDDIAIIGIAGRYPGARDLNEFWENLRQGRDCITEIPAERWDYRLSFDPDKSKAGTTYCKWGGFLEGVDEFDAPFFNISPREAQVMDPQERLFLECVFATIEDAGYTRNSMGKSASDGLGGNVGVFVGVMYEEYQLFGAEAQMQGHPVTTVGVSSWIANRVSYFCNFHGPSMAVDTMCSSSLTAIHLACQSIRLGECELAIAGGVNVSIHPNKYLYLAQSKFVSSQGHCESFGLGADGYVPAEGVGAVLLKPLAQAEADGDHIYAVIKATAVNHGGKTNGSTVPNPHAQAEVIRRAMRGAAIDPRTITYIEAHGTGTVLGDPIEIAGLTRAFQNVGGGLGQPPSSPAAPSQWCAIGSVKSNIGHAEGAAGIAGVTKVLLQMRYGQLVPSLHSRTCNPHIDFSATPFIVQQELAEWQRPRTQGQETLRRAGVSSFGAGGSNAHVILEEYRESEDRGGRGRVAVWEGRGESETDPGSLLVPAQQMHPALIVLSARTEAQLHERAQQLLAWIQDESQWTCTTDKAPSLRNLAYTLQIGREAMEERQALQVSSLQELEEKLESYLQKPQEGGDWYRGQAKRNDPMRAFAADEDEQKTVAAWMSKGKYEKLLEWWVKGLTIDWTQLYAVGAGFTSALPRRISLPTYPFARERYWLRSTPPPSEVDRGRYLEASRRGRGSGVAGRGSLTDPTPEKEESPSLTPLSDEKASGPVEQTHRLQRVALRSLAASPLRASNSNSHFDDHSKGADQPSINGASLTVAPEALSVVDPRLALGLEEELARSLAQALYMEQKDIDVDIPYVDMGLDSVIGVEWIQSLNKAYAIDLAASSVYDYPTIRQLAGFLQKELLKRQPMPVPSMLTHPMDDVLQQVQRGNLDTEKAEQLLDELFLSMH